MKKLLFIFLLLPAVLQGQVIFTIAGNGVGMGTATGSYSGDGGPATAAGLSYPTSVAVDGAGNVYIADNQNHRVRKIDAAGIITTIAGDGTAGCSGDGGPSTAARLYIPNDVALDKYGGLLIADYSCGRVRRIDTTGIITTIAGNGMGGLSGDGGPATAAAVAPWGIALDIAGNIYIADDNKVIRKVDTAGIITTIAGTGVSGYSGDEGPATAATFESPQAVATDSSGNIYVADFVTKVIRKITPDGRIHLFAGTPNVGGGHGDSGPATNAQLNFPTGIKADNHDNVIIADGHIRQVNTMGIINTIIGTGPSGYSGDGGDPLLAQLWGPYNICLNTLGYVYVADAANHRIRLIRYDMTGISQAVNGADDISVYPNPVTGIMHISSPVKMTRILITDMLGRTVYTRTSSNEALQIDVASLPNGVYVVQVVCGDSGDRIVKKFVKE